MKKFLSALLLSSLFIPTALASTSYQEGYYTAKVTANIRAQAGMQGKLIGNITAHEEIYVRAQKGQWCDVEYRSFEHAYIACSLLEEVTFNDDYYYDDYNNDSQYDDNYSYPNYDSDPWVMPKPEPCDPVAATCSGDFKVGVTADLKSDNTYDDFRTLKLNLHGQGRLNVKDAEHPELSFSVNGSFTSDMGSAQGSAEMVMKDKAYIRINDLQSINIPGMSAALTEDMQTMLLKKWFVLPTGDAKFFNSAMLMGGQSNHDIQGLVAMSKFVGKDVNGSDVRYHYQLDMDEKKMNWMMDAGSDEQHLTGNQSTAVINYWLDSTQRLVSGTVALKIVPTSYDKVSGTVNISFDSSNLNQDIHVTVPESAEPLPHSLPHHSNLMLL